jgi:hypothetical protein
MFNSLILKPIGQLIDRIVCVAAAILLSQFPAYYLQYQNVLSGALAEAEINYKDIDKRAAELKLTIEEFVQHHLDSSDSVFHSSGEHFQEMLTRYNNYKMAVSRFQEANIFEKPFVLWDYYDERLAEKLEFHWEVPLTTEAGVYALVGIFLALLLMNGIRSFFNPKKKETPKEEISKEV